MSKTQFFAATALFVLSSSTALAGDTPESLVKEGNFFGEARYRYEYVDQDGIANRAKASTMRTNLGFKTGKYKNFQGLIEGQVVQTLGAESFNDSVNGETSYPLVPDPETAEVNQAWVAWSGLLGTEVKLGRQTINFDNQRFIGTANWRQNDQTYDAAMLTYTGIEKTTLNYGYVRNVNRVNGDDHTLGDLNTHSHLLRGEVKWAEWLNVSAYAYWLDFKRMAASSSQTYGARATGKVPVSADWTLAYEAEAATQNDYANNTANYDEEYYHISPSLSGHGFTFQAGYEVLGGDGTSAFQTPLASMHPFNGWADKFLTTPAAGLEDAYGLVSYKISGVNPAVNDTVLTAAYHDFDGQESGDFGDEIDLSIGKTFTLPEAQPFEKINFLVKYADYNADDTSYTDTQKLWFQVGVNF